MNQSNTPYSDAEIDAFERERQERRLPGYSRVKARRALELFKASRERQKKRKLNGK